MRIWWSKCPNCGNTLEVGEAGNIPIGEMFVRCPNCNHILKTGRKEWEMMDFLERSSFLFRVVFTFLFFTAGLILVIWAALRSEEYDPFWVISISAIVYIVATVGTTKDAIGLIFESKKRMRDESYRKTLKMKGMI